MGNSSRPYEGLLLIWMVVRVWFEAVVWATLAWTASESFYPIEWISLFWVFFAILFLLGLKLMGAEPWLARVMLVTDPMLVGMAVLQAVMCALIPTVITIVVANLISSWTHMEPDWLHVFLFFGCGIYILWRRNGKKRAVQAWKGEPKPEWKTSDLFKGPSPVEHLPEWQREKLTEHRQQRSSLKVEEGRGVWTRAPGRSLVTELELYWAQVSPLKNNKIGFAVYSKKSGQMAQMGYDYDAEKQAMDAAIAWMRHGKSPEPVDQSFAQGTGPNTGKATAPSASTSAKPLGSGRKTLIVFLMAIVASACIYFLYANPGWPGFSIAWSGLVNSADQEIAIIAIAFGIAAYLAVLYAFWRRKRDRWIIFIFTLVSIFTAPTFALVAILGAAFVKIDQSKPLNSNKKLELMMWSVTGGVFVICLTFADLQLISPWVAIAITIASLAVNGLGGVSLCGAFWGQRAIWNLSNRRRLSRMNC